MRGHIIENVSQFYAWHHANTHDSQRLGQRFFNMYLKSDKDNGPWLQGLYEADEVKAKTLIEGWLLDHQYFGTMPEPLKGAPHGKCNRTACQQLHADWWNPGTRAYYCFRCARDINDACRNDSHWKMIVKVY